MTTFKVRGRRENLQEAQSRAEMLRRIDNNRFNMHTAQIGCWCPWSANPDEIACSEYGETQLNRYIYIYIYI